METKESLLDVLKVLFKWKKYIIYTVAAAAIGSIIFSLLLSNFYQSSCVFYPANPVFSSAKNIFGGYDNDVFYFGGKKEIDQLMTIMNSPNYANDIIREFDLYAHYDVDSTKSKANFKVQEKFFKMFNYKKNERDALVLSFEDKDPVFAARVTQFAINLLDQHYRTMSNGNHASMLKTYEKDIERRTAEVIVLTDSLTSLRMKYGIYDIGSMSENLPAMVLSAESELAFKEAKLETLKNSPGVKRDSITYLNASVNALKRKLGSISGSDSLSKAGSFNLAKFNEGIEKVRILERLQQQRSATVQSINERYLQLKTSVEAEVSTLIIMEPPSVPEVKSRPRRSILVITACMVAFIFSVIGVLVLDHYKDVDWSEVVNAS